MMMFYVCQCYVWTDTRNRIQADKITIASCTSGTSTTSGTSASTSIATTDTSTSTSIASCNLWLGIGTTFDFAQLWSSTVQTLSLHSNNQNQVRRWRFRGKVKTFIWFLEASEYVDWSNLKLPALIIHWKLDLLSFRSNIKYSCQLFIVWFDMIL